MSQIMDTLAFSVSTFLNVGLSKSLMLNSIDNSWRKLFHIWLAKNKRITIESYAMQRNISLKLRFNALGERYHTAYMILSINYPNPSFFQINIRHP